MKRSRTLALATAVSAVALATASCSSTSTPAPASSSAPSAAGSSTPGSSAPAPASGPVLTISDFAFSTLSVKAGTAVTLKNSDSVAHTVNVNGTSIDVTVPAGGQATLTAPTKPGAYPLTCDFHPRMHGMLTVTA